MRAEQELLELAAKLEAAASWIEQEAPHKTLQALVDGANQIGKAFSGSWIGYHARTYYAGFQIPPRGAHFSTQWGRDSYIGETRGDWQEYNNDDVKQAIQHAAGSPDLSEIRDQAFRAGVLFRKCKADIASILMNESSHGEDGFVQRLLTDLDIIKQCSAHEAVKIWQPSNIMSADTEAVGQGLVTPVFIAILADATSLSQTFVSCRQLAELSQKAGSHLARKANRRVAAGRVGTNVLIGHGRSAAWLHLQNFIQQRLKLPADEFNRVPIAGITNTHRLGEMLDAAAVAFIIMTAEDEQKDGKLQARMNVIHEVGLFQGRLGFHKAIVLLEEGCEEFSNIQGLGQLRFPAGRISATFEDVRQVLEREGLLSD